MNTVTKIYLSAVNDGGLKILTASKTYGIPFGTLCRRVKGHVDSDRFNRGPRTALSEEVERELKETILEFQKKGFGLTRKEVMELAAKTDASQENPVFKSGHGESWICCQTCRVWYHQTCQKLTNSAAPKKFICLQCRPK